MASEETTQTATENTATDNQTADATNAVLDNLETPAQTAAEATGDTNDAENVIAEDSTNNDATAETTTDASETDTDSADNAATDSKENSANGENADAFTTEATAPEIAALDEVHSEETMTETAQTPATEEASAKNADAETVPAIEEPAKKENVVVKKLTRNPNAPPPPPEPEQPAPAAAATTTDTRQQQQQRPAKNAPTAKPPVRRPTAPSRPPQPEDEQVEGMDFGAILEQYEKEQLEEQAKYREGTLLEGTVTGVSERGVMVNFGYKSEGMVSADEFTENGAITVKVGDATEVVVKRLENPEGIPELSRSEAVQIRTWDMLEKAGQDGTPVKGIVTDKVKGGLNVDINGIEAFLPGSLIDTRPPRNLDAFKGQEIEARVIKFSRKRGNIVLSRKALLDEVVGVQKAETLANIGDGFIVEGKVKSMTDYGAFVDLGGIDGLLHVTDMSWGKLDKPSDMLRVGDEVQVKVLRVDRERERISLGYKHLIPDPWQSVAERYAINSKQKGVVTSTTDYGAFVELEPGIEGLVHVSEMSWSKRAKHPNKIVSPGQEIEVQVLRIDNSNHKDRRVSLGMRQAIDNPWETIQQRYPIGTRVSGRVRNMTEFGAFVELEEGVDGLVHLSDISHKKLKHPSEALKKNQEVEAVVTGVNIEGRRMSLSMKDLQPSTWDAFVREHKPGDVVTGKITRFANFGVFVELGEDLEGLCHVSELSDERIEKPEKVYDIGQELEFKILRIEPDVQKIGLSHRAVGKEDEQTVDTKTYSSDAKSGMASLGELANLRNLMSGGEEAKETNKEETKAETKESVEVDKADSEAEVESDKAEPATEVETDKADSEVEVETDKADSEVEVEADKQETEAETDSTETNNEEKEEK